MRKLYLNWDRVPVILFVNNDDSLNSAFMKIGSMNNWRSVNPLQVFAEGVEYTRRQWLDHFKTYGVEILPKPKDWDGDTLYEEEHDPQWPQDTTLEEDLAAQAQRLSKEEEIDPLPDWMLNPDGYSRLEYHEDDDLEWEIPSNV